MKRRLKKLELNRETLRALEGKELSRIQGGISQVMYCYTDTCTCYTWCYRCIEIVLPQ